MRMKDYLRLGWDQLMRRKVVTALCALGIAIGSSSIIVALAFGESITYYTEKQMNYYLKMDEISLYPGYVEASGDRPAGTVPITEQTLAIIRGIPGVAAVSSSSRLDHFAFVADETRSGYTDITSTDLTTLVPFGQRFLQGGVSELDNTVVLSYSATLDLIDQRTAMISSMQGQPAMSDEQPPIPYPLYQKTIMLTKQIQSGDATRLVTYPLRVVGVLDKPEGMSDNQLRWNKQAYVSPRTAELIREAFRSDANPYNAEDYKEIKVKVENPQHVQQIETVIRKLNINTNNNLYQKERMNQEFVIVRFIFGGIGLFVLFVASLSIVVAMTMATHQRRRQIGIMKVLGANLAQIRNMFIIESMLLGWLGGLIGILLSYWVIWAINIVVLRFSGQGADSEILFISSWILPVGLLFAIFTGIFSGLYPAVKASRTDALTAIKRE